MRVCPATPASREQKHVARERLLAAGRGPRRRTRCAAPDPSRARSDMITGSDPFPDRPGARRTTGAVQFGHLHVQEEARRAAPARMRCSASAPSASLARARNRLSARSAAGHVAEHSSSSATRTAAAPPRDARTAGLEHGGSSARTSSPRPGRSRPSTSPPSSCRELARERQAEARPLDARLEPALDLRELLEDLPWSSGAMPMPVSATENATASRLRPGRADPDLARLGELERVRDEVAQDLRDLALVGDSGGRPSRLLEDERHRVG